MAEPKKTAHKDQKLLDAYAVVAEAARQEQTARIHELVKEHPGLVEPMPGLPQGKYTYYIRIDLTAIVGVTLTIDFYDWNNHDNHLAVFVGHGAGISFGHGTTWGVASLSYDINALVGQDGNFMAHFALAETSIDLFTLGNDYVGNCLGGGIVVGIGLMGGKGHYAKP